MTTPTVTVICGGVGAARFLRGLVDVIDPQLITAVVNVADDMVLHGLSISPDIDTITYTLADAIDPDRGWGLVGETWEAMDALGRYGDRNWFSLGDKDLATHMQRTARLREGATLTEVTAEIAAAWNIGVTIAPVSDDRISTHVTRADTGEEITFQEYFVGLGHDVPISSVRFDNIDHAVPTATALAAVTSADIVVIAPSNPIVSIAPVLNVPGMLDALDQREGATVAISPIVGGKALKGPAANMLNQLDHNASAIGVAELWSEFIDCLLIDDADAQHCLEIAIRDVVPFVTDTIMGTPARRARLAQTTMSAANLFDRGTPLSQKVLSQKVRNR